VFTDRRQGAVECAATGVLVAVAVGVEFSADVLKALTYLTVIMCRSRPSHRLQLHNECFRTTLTRKP